MSPEPEEDVPDTFAEKLATQIIKNLQIKIAKIHIRYEDIYTIPERPVAIGVTLQELLFHVSVLCVSSSLCEQNICALHQTNKKVMWNEYFAFVAVFQTLGL